MLREGSSTHLSAGQPAAAAGARTIGQDVIGIALVDQVPLFREGLAQRLARAQGMQLMGATGHLHTALQLRDRASVDLLVVDAVLDPGGHLAQLLIGANERLSVLVLIREPFRTGRFVAAMQAAGVHGLALRCAPPDRILEAIRRTHADRRYLDPALAPLVGRSPAEAARVQAQAQGMPPRRALSNREYQVLQLVADGLPNQAIADTLFVSVETVRTHIKNVLRKLEARDRAHAVALGFRAGLLVPEPERFGPAAELGRRIPVSRAGH
jgi:DNA-binding NarL/FixJ family response regulator